MPKGSTVENKITEWELKVETAVVDESSRIIKGTQERNWQVSGFRGKGEKGGEQNQCVELKRVRTADWCKNSIEI